MRLASRLNICDRNEFQQLGTIDIYKKTQTIIN